MRKFVAIIIVLLPICVFAQQYSGMSGLIQVPSAEMDSEGDARIGAHFMHNKFLPESSQFKFNGGYNTYDFYLSITPFWWVEAGFTMTLMKGTQTGFIDNPNKYSQKDRYFSLKLNPIKEGKYCPAIVIGGQDFIDFRNKATSQFMNIYVAMTKHFNVKNQEFGATLVYRYYDKSYNHRWNGVVGGITYRPSFARNWRAIVEWTGCDVNFGVDCLLWRHLLLQASLQDGKYPSAGVCYKVNLF